MFQQQFHHQCPSLSTTSVPMLSSPPILPPWQACHKFICHWLLQPDWNEWQMSLLEEEINAIFDGWLLYDKASQFYFIQHNIMSIVIHINMFSTLASKIHHIRFHFVLEFYYGNYPISFVRNKTWIFFCANAFWNLNEVRWKLKMSDLVKISRK